jgi:hypothetical protein
VLIQNKLELALARAATVLAGNLIASKASTYLSNSWHHGAAPSKYHIGLQAVWCEIKQAHSAAAINTIHTSIDSNDNEKLSI